MKALVMVIALCGLASAQPITNGGGLAKVVHDASLTGNGTNASPLAVSVAGGFTVAGAGLSSSGSTVSLHINSGTTQTCGANQAVVGLTTTALTSCAAFVTSISATGPLTSTGGSTPTLGLTLATSTTIANNTHIAAWGDSLTNGGGSTGFGDYPDVLAMLSGYYVYNGGVGGETSTQIKTRMIADTAKLSWPVVIWAGRNNFSSPATVEADIASMVAALGHTNYIILGIVNSDIVSEYSGGADYITITGINTYLAGLYGAHFIDIRSYMVSLYNPSVPQDVIDHGHDVPPSSLRSDFLHYNNAGNQDVADRVYLALAELQTDPQRVVTEQRLGTILTLRPTLDSLGTINHMQKITGQAHLGDTSLVDDGTYVYTTEHVGIGTSTPSGELSVLSWDVGSLFSGLTSWGGYTNFGPNVASPTGAAIGIGYSTTDDAANIAAIAPGVAWKPLRIGSHGIFLNAADGTTALTVDSTGKAALGTSTLNAKLEVASTDAGNPASFSAWGTAHTVFGPNAGSATGAALALAYSTTNDLSAIISIAPGVAWKPLRIYSGGLGFYTSNGSLGPSIDTGGNFTVPGLSTFTGGYNASAESTISSAVGTTDAAVASTPNLALIDTTSSALGVGAGITLWGAYTGTTTTNGGGIKLYKSNSTGGDYSFDLGLLTRANGGSLTRQVTIESSGAVDILNGVLNMHSHQINSVTDPASAQDAVTLNYLTTHAPNEYSNKHLEWNDDWLVPFSTLSASDGKVMIGQVHQLVGSGVTMTAAPLSGVNLRPGMIALAKGTSSSATDYIGFVSSNQAVSFGDGNWSYQWVGGVSATSSTGPTVSSAYNMLIGFYDTPTAIDQVDGCYFLYDVPNRATGGANSGNAQDLEAVCVSNSVRTVYLLNGTGTCDASFAKGTAAVGAWANSNTNVMNLKVSMIGTTEADFFYNGTQVCKITTNIPTNSSLRLTGFGFELMNDASTAAADKQMYVDYTSAQLDMTSTRSP